MQALIWEGPRTLVMRETVQPVPGPDEVLIKVAYSGICGSELSGYLGHNSLRVPPLIMGHEFSGEVVAVGTQVNRQKAELAVGQRVTVNPLIHCGQCRHCVAGRHNLCLNRQILGIHRPGSFADFVKVPASAVYPLPNQLSLEHAALAEPLGCALRAVKLTGATATDSLFIAGLGPIGLLCVMVAKSRGVQQIVATDTDADRRAMGEQLGIQAVDPSVVDVAKFVRETIGSVDVAIDAVGLAVTRKACVDAVRRGGRVVLVGLHDEESIVQSNLIVRSEITVQGSFAYTVPDFEEGLAWLSAGQLRIDRWLEKAPLNQGGVCFERLLGKPGPVAKILLQSPTF